MSFKLYEDLEKNCDLNTVEIIKSQEWIEDFRIKIKKMSQDNINYLYLLIRYDSLIDKEESKELIQLPYNSKQLKSRVKFDLELFPEKLQKIIVLFVNKTFNN
jgi:hypothetical protein